MSTKQINQNHVRISIFQALHMVAIEHHRTMMLLILSFFISTKSIEKSTFIMILSIIIAAIYLISTSYGFISAKGVFSFLISERLGMKVKPKWVRGLMGFLVGSIILFLFYFINGYMTDHFINIVDHAGHDGFVAFGILLLIIALFLANYIEEIAILETVGYVDSEHERAEKLNSADDVKQSDVVEHAESIGKKEWLFRVILALMILFRR